MSNKCPFCGSDLKKNELKKILECDACGYTEPLNSNANQDDFDSLFGTNDASKSNNDLDALFGATNTNSNDFDSLFGSSSNSNDDSFDSLFANTNQSNDFDSLFGNDNQTNLNDFDSLLNNETPSKNDFDSLANTTVDTKSPDFDSITSNPKQEVNVDFDSIQNGPKQEEVLDFDSISNQTTTDISLEDIPSPVVEEASAPSAKKINISTKIEKATPTYLDDEVISEPKEEMVSNVEQSENVVEEASAVSPETIPSATPAEVNLDSCTDDSEIIISKATSALDSLNNNATLYLRTLERYSNEHPNYDVNKLKQLSTVILNKVAPIYASQYINAFNGFINKLVVKQQQLEKQKAFKEVVSNALVSLNDTYTKIDKQLYREQDIKKIDNVRDSYKQKIQNTNIERDYQASIYNDLADFEKEVKKLKTIKQLKAAKLRTTLTTIIAIISILAVFIVGSIPTLEYELRDYRNPFSYEIQAQVGVDYTPENTLQEELSKKYMGKDFYVVTDVRGLLFDFHLPMKNVVIPDQYKGIDVVGVGHSAFSNTYFDTLTLSDNLMFVENYAFEHTKMSQILWNNNINHLPSDIVYVGHSAFSANNLNDLVIYSTIKYISSQAFDSGHELNIQFTGNSTQWLNVTGGGMNGVNVEYDLICFFIYNKDGQRVNSKVFEKEELDSQSSIHDILSTTYYSKEHYNYIGYKNQLNNELVFNEKGDYIYSLDANEDIHLYPAYTPKNYNLKWELNGGAVYNNLPTISNHDKITDFNNFIPVKAGYEFLGWCTSSNTSSGVMVSSEKDIVEDTTLYAIYNPITYGVEYYSFMGDYISTFEIKTGEHFNVPYDELRGYEFIGYFTEDDGQGEQVTNNLGNSIKPYDFNNNLYIYAHYEPVEYTITYHLDGGSFDNSAIIVNKYTVNDDVYYIPSPSKLGYTFDAWYTSENGSDSIYRIFGNDARNYDLYARYTPNSYDVYICDEAGTYLNYQSINYGSNYTLTYTEYPGKAFQGYFTELNGQGTQITDIYGQSLKAWDTTSYIYVYPYYTKATYTVTYEANGGELVDPNFEYVNEYCMDSDTFLLPEMTKTGYTFDAWYKYEDYSGSAYTEIVSGTYGHLTLYAKFDPIAFDYTIGGIEDFDVTVTFNSNGGTSVASQTLNKDNTTLTVPSNPTRSGYVFRGWYEDEDCTEYYDFSKAIANDMTLYAGWESNLYYSSYYQSYYIDPTSFTSTNYASYNISSSSSYSSPYRLSFVANETNTNTDTYYNMYYRTYYSYSSYYNVNIIVYNETQNELILDTTTLTYSSVFNNLQFQANAGDLISVYFYDYSYSTNIDIYFEGFKENPTTSLYALAGSVNYGGNYTLGVVEKDYYTFLGYYTEANGQGTQITDGEGNSLAPWTFLSEQTFYPVYEITDYSIEYNYTEGELVNPDHEFVYEYNYESESIDLPLLAMTGYEFLGWFDNPDYEGEGMFTIPSGSHGDLTLYAKFEVGEYDLTVDGVFDYEYTVTFNSGSFGNAIPSQDINKDNPSIDLPIPTSTNVSYIFSGWYKDPYYNEKFDISDRITSDMTLYARWISGYYSCYMPEHIDPLEYSKDNPLNVSISSDTYSSYLKRISFTVNQTKSSTDDKFKIYYRQNYGEYSAYNYYVFLYNETTRTRIVSSTYTTYGTEYKVFEFNANLGDAISLYFYDDGYTTSADVYFKGFEVEEVNKYNVYSVTYNTSYTLPVIERTGMTFIGYYTEPNGQGTLLTDSEGNSLVNWAIESDTTVYAHYDYDIYTISYTNNNGELAESSPQYVYEYRVIDTVMLPELYIQGYEFVGWYDNAEFAGLPMRTINAGSNTNYDLYAKFEVGSYEVTIEGLDHISYEVSFETNGGSTVDPQTLTVDNPTLSIPTNPTKSGSVFKGWYTDSECTEYYDFSEKVTGDMTLYAGWESNFYYSSYYTTSVIDPTDYTSSSDYFSSSINSSSGSSNRYRFNITINETNVGTDEYYKIYYAQNYYTGYNYNYYIVIYNETTDTAILSSTDVSYQSGTYSYASFQANAGDVISIYIYDYYYSTYAYLYFENFDVLTSVNSIQTTFTFGYNDDPVNFGVYEKPGYVFKGFYTEDKGQGTQIADENGQGLSNWTIEQDITIYPYFDPINYSITYNDANGELADPNYEYIYEYNADYEDIVLPQLYIQAYEFIGWFDNEECSGDPISTIVSGTYGDIELWAKFEVGSYDVTISGIDHVSYDVTFDYNLSYDHSETQTITPTNNTLTIPTPTNTGYVFKGWYTDEECTEYYDFSERVTSDMTLYAAWEDTGTFRYTSYYSQSIVNPYTYVNSSLTCSISSNSSTYPSRVVFALTEDSVSGDDAMKVIYKVEGYSSYSNFNTLIINESTDEELYNSVIDYGTGTDVEVEIIGNAGDVIVIYNYSSNSTYPTAFISFANCEQLTPVVSVQTLFTFAYNDEPVNFGFYEKDGYTFKGYYTEDNGQGTQIADETGQALSNWTIEEDVTLYPYYEATKFNISYIDYDGELVDPNYEYVYEYYITSDEITLPTLSKTGYTFIGWYDNEECTGDVLTSIATGSFGDKELYACFESLEFEVTVYNLADTVASITYMDGTTELKKEFVSEENTIEYYAPTKENYLFAGWYTSTAYTELFNFNGDIDENVTVYAKWYDVSSYLYKGAVGTDTSLSTGYSVTYVPFVPLVSGNISVRSSFSIDMYGYLYNSQLYQLISDDDSGGSGQFSYTYSVTAGNLYYVGVRTYSSSYTSTSVSGYITISGTQYPSVSLTSSADMSHYIFNVYYGKEYEYNYYEKPGFDFVGLYSQANGQGTQYVDADGNSIEAWDELSDKILYAYYTDAVYDIVYEDFDGELVDSTYEYIYEYAIDSDTFALPTLTKVGYDFIGWYDNAEFNGSILTSIETGTYGDLTLYAKFNPHTFDYTLEDLDHIDYTVTFETNGGSSVSSQTISISNPSISIPTPTKSGYVFKGWYKDSECTEYYDFSEVITSDMTLYAGWESGLYYSSYYSANTINPTNYTSSNNYLNNYISSSSSSSNSYRFNITINETNMGTDDYYKIYYAQNYYSSYNYNYYILIYNETSDTMILSSTNVGYRNGAYSYASFQANAGDVISIYIYDYYYSTYAYMYFEGFETQIPSSLVLEDTINYGDDFTLPVYEKEYYTFVGYFEEEDGQGTQVTDGEGNSLYAWNYLEDKTFYAYYVITDYSITYDLADGELVDSAYEFVYEYNYLSSTISLPQLTKVGYTFNGWYNNEELTGIPTIQITSGSSGNLDLYAKFTPNQYSINVDNNSDSISVAYDSDFTYEDYAKSGYVFKGLFTEENGEGTQIIDGEGKSLSPYTYTTDLAVYSYYTIITYAVTYDENDGELVDSTYSYTETYQVTDSDITLPELSKYGYTFVGWYDNEEFNGSVLTVIDTDTCEDLNLYAKFNVNEYSITINDVNPEYTVTFESNGGTYYSPQTINKSNPTLAVLNPTKSGCIFKGWYKDSECTEYYDFSEAVTSDMTLYAAWESSFYYSSYYSLSNINPTSYYNSYNYLQTYITSSTYSASRNRYNFAINETNEGTDEYFKIYYAQRYANSYNYNYNIFIYNESTDTVILENTLVSYSSSYYEVSFQASAGDVISIYIYDSYNYGTYANMYFEGFESLTSGGLVFEEDVEFASDYSLPVYAVEGYSFNGYYTEANGQGTQVTDSEGKSLEAYLEAADKNVYAYYTPIEYSITYNTNDGELEDESYEYVYTYSIVDTVTLPTLTKAGYTFNGWYDNEEFSGSTYTSITDTYGDLELYAKFTANTYALTFDAGEGNMTFNVDFMVNNEVWQSQTVAYNESIEYLMPELEGYIFAGWYTNSDCTTAYDFSSSISDSLTLYSKWYENSSSTVYRTGYSTSSLFISSTTETLIPFVPLVSETITLSTTGGLDTLCKVYYSNGTSVYASADTGGSGNNFSLSINVTANTLYYISVYGASGEYGYVQSFSIEGTEKPASTGLVSSIKTYTYYVTYGEEFTLMNASHESKEFAGWVYNSEVISEGTWTYTSDITVEASWSE